MEENELPGLLGAAQILLQPRVLLTAWPIASESIYLQANEMGMAVVKGIPALVVGEIEEVEIVWVVELMVAQRGEEGRIAQQLPFNLEEDLPARERN